MDASTGRTGSERVEQGESFVPRLAGGGDVAPVAQDSPAQEEDLALTPGVANVAADAQGLVKTLQSSLVLVLVFGGHFSTKSRRYSTTGHLRAARRQWHRPEPETPIEAVESGDEPDILTGHLTYAGIGWHTSADAQLANTAANQARERRQVAREEIEFCQP